MPAAFERNSPQNVLPRETSNEPFLDTGTAPAVNPIFREKLEEMARVNWEDVPRSEPNPELIGETLIEN